jgi:hypothetical protein
MLNGNKAASRKHRGSVFSTVVRTTKKSVVTGRAKRGARRTANQNLWKEVCAD